MIDDGPIESLQAWGAPQNVIDAYRRGLIEEAKRLGVEVWPQHWHAVRVFMAMGSQWRVVAGFGGARTLGMDYGALPPVLDEHRRSRHRQPMRRLMPQLRTLEAAALEVLNKE